MSPNSDKAAGDFGRSWSLSFSACKTAGKGKPESLKVAFGSDTPHVGGTRDPCWKLRCRGQW